MPTKPKVEPKPTVETPPKPTVETPPEPTEVDLPTGARSRR